MSDNEKEEKTNRKIRKGCQQDIHRKIKNEFQ